MVTKVISNNTAANDYTGSENTNLLQSVPNNNDSANQIMYVGMPPVNVVGQWREVVLSFKGLTNISGPVDVSSSALTLNVISPTVGTVEISLYRLLVPWVLAEATWNKRTTANTWGLPGALDPLDAVAAPSGTISVNINVTGPITISSAGIAQDVQAWINGDLPNYGWIIRRSDGITNQNINARFQGNFGLPGDGSRPSLSVTYAPRVAQKRPLRTMMMLAGLLGRPQGASLKAAPGFNLGVINRYSTSPFINVIHQDSYPLENNAQQPVTTWDDGDGWVSNMTNGSYVWILPFCDLRNNTPSPNFYIRTGVYYATWTGPMSVAFIPNDQTGSNVVVGTNKCAITVNTGYNPAGKGSVLLTVELRNSTGAPLSFNASNNLQVYHADDEADLLAGELLQSNYRNKLMGASVLRAMDWTGTNQYVDLSLYAWRRQCAGTSTATILNISAAPDKNFDASLIGGYVVVQDGTNVGRLGKITAVNSSTSLVFEDEENPGNGFPVPLDTTSYVGVYGKGFIRNPSDWPTENTRQWTRVPLTVLAKTCKRVGSDLWINIPPAATPALMLHMAQTLSSIYTAGTVYVEVGNENWNTAGAFLANRAYLGAYSKRKGTAVSASGAPSTSGDDRVSCGAAEVAMQAWSIFEPVFGRNRIKRVVGGWLAGVNSVAGGLEFADPGYILAGAKLRDLMDVFALAPYTGLSSNPTTTVDLHVPIQENWAAGNFNNLVGLYENGITRILGWMLSVRTLKASKFPTKPLTSYECGLDNGVAGNDGQTGTALIEVTVDTGNNALQVTDAVWSSLLSNFSDNDAIRFPDAYLGMFSGATANKNYLVKRTVGNTRLQLFASQSTYDANTPITLVAGVYKIGNYTRLLAWNGYKDSFRDSPECGELHKRFYMHVFRDEYEVMCQYWDIGGYEGGMWGMSRSQYEADNPALSWFKTLAR